LLALRKRVKIRLRIAVEGRRSVPLFGATSFAHYPYLMKKYNGLNYMTGNHSIPI